jgi:hypothetical protein
MNSRRIPEDDRYCKKTDEARIELVDGTVRDLGAAALQARFGVDPALARTSGKHFPVALYIKLAELYCNSTKTGPFAGRKLLNKAKEVSRAREKEITRHEQISVQTPAIQEGTGKHKHFLRK